jgi:hypothetical protein
MPLQVKKRPYLGRPNELSPTGVLLGQLRGAENLLSDKDWE